jgi:hypothetical protein
MKFCILVLFCYHFSGGSRCDVFWYTLSNETIGFFFAFSLLKKASNLFTNFWHSGDKSDFLSILQNMQNITNGKRPCKSNRPKERAKILDDFDHCVIKRTIHGLYSRKIAPTVSIIHKEIKDSIKISKSIITYFFL